MGYFSFTDMCLRAGDTFRCLGMGISQSFAAAGAISLMEEPENKGFSNQEPAEAACTHTTSFPARQQAGESPRDNESP